MSWLTKFRNGALRSLAVAYIFMLALALSGCMTDRSQISSSGLASSTPEGRALAFLTREVPLWSKANNCFSCHNNGDAARALYTASQRSYPVPKHALVETSAWLAKPGQWANNRGNPSLSDKRLARIQFAAALVTAIEAGHVRNPGALVHAAELVAECQDQDGAWRLDVSESIGAPATYGTYLITSMALQTLRAARSDRFHERIQEAERWVRRAPVQNVLEAAAILLALNTSQDPQAHSQRQQCFQLIQQGQSDGGGWGPYLSSPPEPFDSAVVLLALSHGPQNAQVAEQTRRGRNFLLGQQQADGSWTETTRPPGGESYAERLSTTGWAALALLATKPFEH